MTCIIGYKVKKTVYIAGDSAGIAGDFIQTRADEKVFFNGEFMFGFTSSFRMGQLIRYKFKPPEIPKDMDLMEYMVTTFIDAIRKCLTKGGYAKKKDEVESGGTFIVGIRGRLFIVEDDYQVAEWTDDFIAIGCGRNYALGAMAALDEVDLKPHHKLNFAMDAAAKFSTGVCPPFRIISSKELYEGA